MEEEEREGRISIHLLMPSARNLGVRAKIGEAAIWVVLDTGAAKSFVQTQVSMYMAEDERCKMAAGRRLAIDNPLRVEGVEKGRKVGRISHVRRFYLTLTGHKPGRRQTASSTVPVEACELDTLSERIIIGMPELQAWGLHLDGLDDEARPVVLLERLGLQLGAGAASERPDRCRGGHGLALGRATRGGECPGPGSGPLP